MKEFTILISDRNRNVREFLRRELEMDGYHVEVAKSVREILYWIYNKETVDLVILDPELFEAKEMSLLEKISDRVPSLPLILHAFSTDYPDAADVSSVVRFVEKKGSSIEHLKKAVSELLPRDK